MSETFLNQSAEDDVIVWMPFVVKMKHLKLTPSCSPISIQQPITVHQIQEAETQALLPPPSANNAKTDEKTRKGMASTKQMEWVLNIAKQCGMSESEICEVSGAKSIEQMSNAQANDFISKYKDAKPQF